MKTLARPLRIGYLNQDFVPEVGAGPARLLEMSRRWQALGAEVTVMAGMPNRRIPGRGEGTVDARYSGRFAIEEEWEGIRTLRSWVFTGSGRGFANKMANNASFMVTAFLNAVAKRERFDVLIASSPPFLPHVTGVVLAGVRGVPLVLELRDLWPDYMVEMGMLSSPLARRPLFALERWLLSRADHTVVVTESFRTRVIDKGVHPARTSVISNGVQVDEYYASDESAPIPAAIKAPGEIIVGYLGTFGRGQALATVVHAAAMVAQSAPHVRFVLVGDGPDMPSVREALDASGATNVQVEPPIERTQTRAFYNACDICLVPLAPLPIFQETVPSKIFEVMACERPLIAGVGGEAASIIERSQGGLQVEPGNAEALAAAVLRVAAMPEGERRAMGRRARTFAVEHYSRVALADRYFSLLTRLVDGSAIGTPATSTTA